MFLFLLYHIFIYYKITHAGDIPKNKFKDVTDDHPLKECIDIAAETGIVLGYSDGTMRPDNIVTREEMAAVVDRVMNYIEKNRERVVTTYESGPNYIDEEKISPWAEEYVKNLTVENIVFGYEDGTCRPRKELTRVESVLIIESC